MSEDQTKVSVYRPKVERSPRQAAASTREFAEEEKAEKLALAIACEDPTEREHLSSSVGRARARLKAAAREMVRAFFALIFAYLARLLVDRSYRKVTEERGEVGRAERSVLALRRLLSGFFIRRIFTRKRLLAALGANSRTDDEGNTIYSLKVAERSYRVCDGFGASLASTADLPVIRVFVGVRIAADGEPVWSLKRFVRDEAGAWSEIHACSVADADEAMLYFYMEPSHAGACEPVALAPAQQEPQQTADEAA